MTWKTLKWMRQRTGSQHNSSRQVLSCSRVHSWRSSELLSSELVAMVRQSSVADWPVLYYNSPILTIQRKMDLFGWRHMSLSESEKPQLSLSVACW